MDLFDPFKVDFFLFFERNDEWLKKLANWNLEYKAVYCNAEPPVVNQMHEEDGIKELIKLFSIYYDMESGFSRWKKNFQKKYALLFSN